MRLLLTGATGFVGRSVVRELARSGHTLFVLVRPQALSSPFRGLLSGITRGDADGPLAVAGPRRDGRDRPYGGGPSRTRRKRRDRVMRTNVYGTRSSRRRPRRRGFPGCFHVSSVAAVGYSPDGRPVDETLPYNLSSLKLLYHESKRQAEAEALDVRHYGVEVVIVESRGRLRPARPLAYLRPHDARDLGGGSPAIPPAASRWWTLTMWRPGSRPPSSGAPTASATSSPAKTSAMATSSRRRPPWPASLRRAATAGGAAPGGGGRLRGALGDDRGRAAPDPR